MSGKANKEEGMATVLDHAPEEWKMRYSKLVPEFLREVPLFLGEDVTKWMRAKGIGEPHHENAWGAMFNACIAKSGFAIRTGKTRLATAEKSNAHAFRLWRSMLCPDADQIQTLQQELAAIRTIFHTKKINFDEAQRRAAEAGASSVS